MSAILLGWGFWLVCTGVFVAYWYRRLDREHRQRMAEIEAHAAADEAAFEERKRVWAEEDARARAELDARIAAMTAGSELDDLPAGPEAGPKIASPGGG